MISTETQFSIFMINKPGVLQQVCQELARAKVNIVALTMMDSMEHGVLRVVADDSARTRNVLRPLGVPISETDILLIPIPNQPGAMADICSRLADAKCKVSYAYCTTGARGGKTLGIFKVNNTAKAISTLSSQSSNRRRNPNLRRPMMKH